MSSVISDKHFHDERAAYAYMSVELWPNGPTCPHCGNADVNRIRLMQGKSTRIGVRQCNDCRKPFTVKIGTIFEVAIIPLRLWLQAIHLLCSSKKGISSNQLHRILGITLKTAWFMSHRIREAMRITGVDPSGGEGKTVEVDETFSGRLEGMPKQFRSGYQAYRNTVLTLVERGGSARSFHVDSTTVADIIPIVNANVARQSAVMTDSASWCIAI